MPKVPKYSLKPERIPLQKELSNQRGGDNFKEDVFVLVSETGFDPPLLQSETRSDSILIRSGAAALVDARCFNAA